MVYIPAELIDYIIDFLHNDKASLRACSLISRTWYPAACYHLYREVCLSSFQSCLAYRSLLEKSIALGSFTRKVKISNALPLIPRTKDTISDPRIELGLCWGFIFPALKWTTHLKLSFLTIHPSLVSNVVQNFPSLCDLTMEYCRFEPFSDFAIILCSFPALQSCSFRGVLAHGALGKGKMRRLRPRTARRWPGQARALTL